MNHHRAQGWSRREFLSRLTLAGTAGLLGLHPRPVATEPPPETTTLRLMRKPSICEAAEYVAEELLQAEGFTEVRYVRKERLSDSAKDVTSGEVDITTFFSPPFLLRLEAGDPLVLLAGVHVGCFELFATERVRGIRDLKGKTVAVNEMRAPEYAFLASMAAYVGLDPHKDITWVIHPPAEAGRLLAEGNIDAFIAFPPFAQELRAQQIAHVVVNSSHDRPWSQYFCCMVGAHREFVRKHPVATKRALRAILKATDLCAQEPERVARFLVDKDYVPRYDYALQVMKELPYNVWREYDPEDTVRFYALRLYEAGMIKSSPQKLIAQGTDWRFLNELKKELKGWTYNPHVILPPRGRISTRIGGFRVITRHGWYLSLLIVLLVVGWGASGLSHKAEEAERLSKIGPAPAFTLTAQDGRRLALSEMRGKVVVVTFIYASCADACPLLTAKMAILQDDLGVDFGPKVFFASITVDPERDTPEVLTHYAKAHGANLAGWAFLTGTPDEIRVVARQYGIYYKKQAAGDVDHTFLTSLVDQSGTLRVQYLGVRFDPDELLHDLQSLLAEGGER